MGGLVHILRQTNQGEPWMDQGVAARIRLPDENGASRIPRKRPRMIRKVRREQAEPLPRKPKASYPRHHRGTVVQGAQCRMGGRDQKRAGEFAGLVIGGAVSIRHGLLSHGETQAQGPLDGIDPHPYRRNE